MYVMKLKGGLHQLLEQGAAGQFQLLVYITTQIMHDMQVHHSRVPMPSSGVYTVKSEYNQCKERAVGINKPFLEESGVLYSISYTLLLSTLQ